MSKKSAKKRQPVVKPAVQETMSATVPLGYEEMLTELEAIVADAEARLAEERPQPEIMPDGGASARSG
ncbi:hypothetical protein M5C33_002136 [Salmonella enterica]|nr:hypothetical protein [Salmonella enterica]EDA4227990.1 hypothetical protein [Salmonella enterica]EEB1553982.1 hypothetical protein [Salmonella enterica]EFR9950376.1 hypothetical protein [Salmonella enterica]EGD2827928.1 hypothetical protein [Salmonella enterica]